MDLHRVTARLDVNDADLSGSRFNDANLSEVGSFNQISLSVARFDDSNRSGWRANDVTLSGAVFQNLNQSGVVFNTCRLTGVMVDGVPLEDAIGAWRRSVGV